MASVQEDPSHNFRRPPCFCHVHHSHFKFLPSLGIVCFIFQYALASTALQGCRLTPHTAQELDSGDHHQQSGDFDQTLIDFIYRQSDQLCHCGRKLSLCYI